MRKLVKPGSTVYTFFGILFYYEPQKYRPKGYYIYLVEFNIYSMPSDLGGLL